MRVSVIVSTYTPLRSDSVIRCIKSLKNQKKPPEEIILVLDANKGLIDFYEPIVPKDVNIVINNGCGLSSARNIGVKSAKGEIIAFIDDDAFPDEEWLENVIKNFDDLNIIGVGGTIRPVWQDGRPDWFSDELLWVPCCSYKGGPDRKSTIRNPFGCNMAFRKTVFEKVGYFNISLGRVGAKNIFGEEMAFSVRALTKIAGSKIVHDPRAIVFHNVPWQRVTIKYVFSRSFYEGFSKGLITQIERNNDRVTSAESEYLHNLVAYGLPSRLIKFYDLQSLLQLLPLGLSTFLVFFGYVIGRFSKAKPSVGSD
jgi:glucosyl-dolichyl phosphate glucuronosyltransferase